MKLKKLLTSLPFFEVKGSIDLDISSITSDSRKVKPGSLFIAVKGFTVDGHDYIDKAISLGATAIVIEKGYTISLDTQQATVIEVKDSRRSMAILADAFYHHPSQQLRLIGITGTNGKTTTTYLIHKILSDFGFKTGLIGTIQTLIGDESIQSQNTTPESIDLQQLFAKMVAAGCQYAVMEVSSHALDMGRVRGTQFKSAIFTNLTQDHLDYHHTMDEYRRAKGLLFSQMGNAYKDDVRPAILNADDPSSTYYERITAAPVITYGIDSPADVRAFNVQIRDTGIHFMLQTWLGTESVHLKLIGKFNVYNALAAITACLIEGIPLLNILDSLAEVMGVNGRFERVEAGQDFTVVVDYAHTPDSLENVLATVGEIEHARIICVIGCGGERDRSKRPEMARIATRYSDYAILTSDNPRREDPIQILQDMVDGIADFVPKQKYDVIVDRKEAIWTAIRFASKSDIIVIAGKGHETYQDLGTHKIHFDDREVALEAIKELIL